MPKSKITETLALSCEGLDAENHVIRGVKVQGLKSKNGHEYLSEAVEKSAPQFEAARVYVNHEAKGQRSRRYEERIGTLQNVSFREGVGSFADFHFNPKHPLAEQLAWDAEHKPENCGLSINVLATFEHRDGKRIVTSIDKVRSVDLVAEPAATESLFEAVQDDDDRPADDEARQQEPYEDEPIEQLTREDLERDHPELLEAVTQSIRTGVANAVKALMASSLPYGAWDNGLIDSIIAADTTEEVDRAIAQRGELYQRLTEEAAAARRRTKPTSKPRPAETASPIDAKTFAESIR